MVPRSTRRLVASLKAPWDVVVSMRGTDEFWPTGRMSMAPAAVTVHVGPILDGADYETDQAFCDAARAIVGEGYLDLVNAMGKSA